eukprot:jgi/Bigna1/83798/fgenesh1_pg.115_\
MSSSMVHTFDVKLPEGAKPGHTIKVNYCGAILPVVLPQGIRAGIVNRLSASIPIAWAAYPSPFPPPVYPSAAFLLPHYYQINPFKTTYTSIPSLGAAKKLLSSLPSVTNYSGLNVLGAPTPIIPPLNQQYRHYSNHFSSYNKKSSTSSICSPPHMSNVTAGGASSSNSGANIFPVKPKTSLQHAAAAGSITLQKSDLDVIPAVLSLSCKPTVQLPQRRSSLRTTKTSSSPSSSSTRINRVRVREVATPRQPTAALLRKNNGSKSSTSSSRRRPPSSMHNSIRSSSSSRKEHLPLGLVSLSEKVRPSKTWRQKWKVICNRLVPERAENRITDLSRREEMRRLLKHALLSANADCSRSKLQTDNFEANDTETAAAAAAAAATRHRKRKGKQRKKRSLVVEVMKEGRDLSPTKQQHHHQRKRRRNNKRSHHHNQHAAEEGNQEETAIHLFEKFTIFWNVEGDTNEWYPAICTGLPMEDPEGRGRYCFEYDDGSEEWVDVPVLVRSGHIKKYGDSDDADDNDTKKNESKIRNTKNKRPYYVEKNSLKGEEKQSAKKKSRRHHMTMKSAAAAAAAATTVATNTKLRRSKRSSLSSRPTR